MTSLGAVFLPQLPPERLPDVARAADDAGLDELWLWEDCFRESGVACAAAALAATRRLRVGIGLLPVPLRNVALTAMEVATLERMFPGRLLVGVGHGVQDWMAQVGARVESPVSLLREYLAALRALLRGERVSTSGRYVRLDAVALDWPPASAPAVLAGAGGPRTLRLSADAADGTILAAGTPVEAVAGARRTADDRRAAAGLPGRHHLVVYLHAATGPDAAERLAGERQRWGYESMEGIAAHGSAEDLAAAVRRWADAGADSVVLQPTPDDPDPEAFMRLVGARVRAMVG